MTRLSAGQRRKMILIAAIKLGNENGINSINFEDVAEACVIKTTARTVRHYFPKIRNLWDAVLQSGQAQQLLLDDAVAMGLVK